jgi:hypothetical protein
VLDFRRAARAFNERLPREATLLRIGAIGGTIGIGGTFFPWLIGVPEDPLVLFRLATACASGVGLGAYLGARWLGPSRDVSAEPSP